MNMNNAVDALKSMIENDYFMAWNTKLKEQESIVRMIAVNELTHNCGELRKLLSGMGVKANSIDDKTLANIAVESANYEVFKTSYYFTKTGYFQAGKVHLHGLRFDYVPNKALMKTDIGQEIIAEMFEGKLTGLEYHEKSTAYLLISYEKLADLVVNATITAL